MTELDFPLEEFLVTVLAEFDQNTTLGCLKMVGELITNSEKLTTKIVSELPQLNLLRSLSLILINYDSQTKKQVLWLVSNICVNSREDALTVI